jgi:hypothetical protein
VSTSISAQYNLFDDPDGIFHAVFAANFLTRRGGAMAHQPIGFPLR